MQFSKTVKFDEHSQLFNNEKTFSSVQTTINSALE